jgi:putative ABC transport system substrate-binding protein
MRRREFIKTIAGSVAALPIAARAQQGSRLPTIGFLGSNASGWGPWTAAFAARLRELGWIEGRNIAIEYRWSEGSPTRVAETAVEFVRDGALMSYGTNLRDSWRRTASFVDKIVKGAKPCD